MQSGGSAQEVLLFMASTTKGALKTPLRNVDDSGY